MKGIVIDVEATGPHPVKYAMIQVGAVTLDGETFSAKMRPWAGAHFDPGAMNALKLTKEEVMDWPDPKMQTWAFYEFLMDTTKGKRIPSWSDNPAFDWQFINAYLHEYADHNPLGFSMRRIGDLYAGHVGDVTAATKWKSLRDTAHTHDALDDAKGNAEALSKILRMMKARK